MNGQVVIFNNFGDYPLSGTSNRKLNYVDVEMDNNVLYEIELRYANKIDETKIQFFWESDSREKEIIKSQYFYSTLNSQTTPFPFDVVADTTNETFCEISGTSYSSAQVGILQTIFIYARDQFNNLQEHQLDEFKVTLVKDSITVNGAVTDSSNGYYQATYTLTDAGLYKMYIEVQPNGIGSFYSIKSSPFDVNCIVSSTHVPSTVLSGSGIASATAGEVAEFLITLKDVGLNQRTSGGDQVQVDITSLSNTISDIQIFDNEDGTYLVKYMITDSSEVYTIDVTINGVAYATSPTVTPVENIPYSSTSEMTTVWTTVSINTAYQVDIVLKDEFTNLI